MASKRKKARRKVPEHQQPLGDIGDDYERKRFPVDDGDDVTALIPKPYRDGVLVNTPLYGLRHAAERYAQRLEVDGAAVSHARQAENAGYEVLLGQLREEIDARAEA